MHRTSTDLPQVFHNARLQRAFGVAIVFVWLVGIGVCAQQPAATPTFRVFLKDGKVLSSAGEYAVVGDRVVFVLAIGAAGTSSESPFMSLPVSVVDLERSAAYVRAVRREYYAATRGEQDFQTLSAEVGRTLDAIKTTADREQRLAIALDSRQRVMSWSKDNYGYKADEVRELVGQFDAVIAALRTQLGQPALSLDLVAGEIEAHVEPVRPAMGLRESIEAALFGAAASDSVAQREDILRATLRVIGAGNPDVDGLKREVSRMLEEDEATDRAYAKLASDMLQRADTALKSGDVRAIPTIQSELASRDSALGLRRVDEVRALSDQLAAKFEATRAFRAELDRFASVKPLLYKYERDVRPVLSGLDGVRPILNGIRDMNGLPGIGYLELAESRLKRLQETLSTVPVPDDLVVRQVQSTFISALRMAIEACARHRIVLAAATAPVRDRAEVAQQGSAAATGALLLVDQARATLLTRLYPPQIKKP